MRTPSTYTVTSSIPPRAKLLRRAIDSISRQTLPVHGMAIAVDHDRDGAAITRQRALDMVPAGVGWVQFLDDDDYLDYDHLEKLHRHAEETGADYVFSWFRVLGPKGIYPTDPVFPPGHYLNPWDPENPRQTTITVLVKADLAREVGFTPPVEGALVGEDRAGEDWDFTLGCNRLGKISHLVDITWTWDHTSKNTSGRPDRW